MIKGIILALVSLVFLGFGGEQAPEKAGEVVKKQGRVKIYRGDSPSGKVIKTLPEDLFVKDMLKTSYASTAFVKLLGVNKLVLTENSVLIIEGIDRINFEGGRAIFQIRKRGEGKGLKIRVKSVIIGIKGTKFAVDVSDDSIGVFLKEGHLSVKKMVGEFIRYRKKTEEEFGDFKREFEEGMKEEREGFEEYKRQTEEEFKEFVKEFELKAGGAVIIKGSEVRDVEIPPSLEEEFRLLDMF